MGSIPTIGQPVNFESPDPAPPSGSVNIIFQADTPTPLPTTVVRNISAYDPTMTSSTPGNVPTPPGVATKYLDGTGNWSTPTGGGGGGGGGGSTAIALEEILIPSAGRALATVYQNTTGAAIIVYVDVGTPSAANQLSGYCDSSSTPTHVVSGASNVSGAGGGETVVMIVPNNYYYKVVQGGAATGTLAYWREFSVVTGSITDSGDLSSNGSGTRAAGTVYHNTGTSTILVLANFTGCTGNTNKPIQGICDSSSSPTTVVWSYDPPNQTGVQMMALFPVMPGEYYKIITNSNSGATLASWHEYTWAGVTFSNKQNYVGLQNSYRAYNQDIQNGLFPLWFTSIMTLGATGDVTAFAAQLENQSGVMGLADAVHGSYACSTSIPVLANYLYASLYNTSSPSSNSWWEWTIS